MAFFRQFQNDNFEWIIFGSASTSASLCNFLKENRVWFITHAFFFLSATPCSDHHRLWLKCPFWPIDPSWVIKCNLSQHERNSFSAFSDGFFPVSHYGSPKEHAYELPLRSLAINVKFILVGDPSTKIYLSFYAARSSYNSGGLFLNYLR